MGGDPRPISSLGALDGGSDRDKLLSVCLSSVACLSSVCRLPPMTIWFHQGLFDFSQETFIFPNLCSKPCQLSRPASQPSNGPHTLTGLRYTYPKLYVFLLHVPCKIDFSEIIVLFLKQKSHISNAFDSFFAPLYKGAKNISKALEIWYVCFKNNTRNSLKSISQGTCNKNTYNLG